MVHSEKDPSSVRLRKGLGEEHGKTGSSRARQVPNHGGLVSHAQEDFLFATDTDFWVLCCYWFVDFLLFFLDNYYNKNITI